jgi:hypothetical protein
MLRASQTVCKTFIKYSHILLMNEYRRLTNWVTKDGIDKIINSSFFDEYIGNGWKKGRNNSNNKHSQTEETRRKIALTRVENDINGSYDNLYLYSSRTKSKIIQRMINAKEIGCSNCNWNESIGDFHHINGRKIEDAHNHNNLCYLCPNCHRLVHAGILPIEKLISLEIQIGDKWKKYAYGNQENILIRPKHLEETRIKISNTLKLGRKI